MSRQWTSDCKDVRMISLKENSPMKKFASIAMVFTLSATFVRAETWTGKLVDAICKASSEAGCPATLETHLFAIELPDSKVLILDARGNEKAAGAIHNAPKSELHATVTGSREGQTVKVETIELR
jgi:hypothetical protein